jgi:hypothetical protein
MIGAFWRVFATPDLLPPDPAAFQSMTFIKHGGAARWFRLLMS